MPSKDRQPDFRAVVTVPVAIQYSDEASLADAKQYLRNHFYQVQASANIEGLHWSLNLGNPILRRINEQPDSE